MNAYWILGDQLRLDHPALSLARKEDYILMIESAARAQHLRYHKHKLILLYSAMRHHAEALKKAGHRVWYHKLEDHAGPYQDALRRFVEEKKPQTLYVMEPNEWEMQEALPKLARKFKLTLSLIPNNQFLVSRSEFKEWAQGKKTLLMASHYQHQRKRLGILLDAQGKPEGGSWSYDSANRCTASDFEKKGVRPEPLPPTSPDKISQAVIAQVEKHFPSHPGDGGKFWLPVTRSEALAWLSHFIQHHLTSFGPFEDTMISGERTLHHSVLSPLINLGLLSPQECVDAALHAYRSRQIPLASVEGFVRQIIGWREFINGIYSLRMPEYRDLNHLQANRELPTWIDHGQTDLHCLKHCLSQVQETGYNHHIQRLMVLGNFFILCACQPKEVLRWYMEMYVDAYDWVMQPNVIGMILYADGGFFATKPYIAGSGYISKMSNYCQHCRFKPAVKTGPDACPFNYLYWNFISQHAARFKSNPRVGMMIHTWKKKAPSEKKAILESARHFFEQNF
jgi:deoxyribodipyrimidine photolyase-related protein